MAYKVLGEVDDLQQAIAKHLDDGARGERVREEGVWRARGVAGKCLEMKAAPGPTASLPTSLVFSPAGRPPLPRLWLGLRRVGRDKSHGGVVSNGRGGDGVASAVSSLRRPSLSPPSSSYGPRDATDRREFFSPDGRLTVDYRAAGALGLPAWYLALRSLVTSGVLLSLLLASLAAAMSG